jgi:hypothetical protein
MDIGGAGLALLQRIHVIVESDLSGCIVDEMKVDLAAGFQGLDRTTGKAERDGKRLRIGSWRDSGGGDCPAADVEWIGSRSGARSTDGHRANDTGELHVAYPLEPLAWTRLFASRVIAPNMLPPVNRCSISDDQAVAKRPRRSRAPWLMD